MKFNGTPPNGQSPPDKPPDHDDLFTDWIPLFRSAMNELGSAAQTFGAFTRLNHAFRDRGVFPSIATLADFACIPSGTCRRHLDKCVQLDWLVKVGREKRRTVTYKKHPEAIEKQGNFGILPRQIARQLPTWSQCAVYSLIASRWYFVTHVDSRGEVHPIQNEWPLFESCGLRIERLAEYSGLSARQVIRAKSQLAGRGLIRIDRSGHWQDDSGRIHTDVDAIYVADGTDFDYFGIEPTDMTFCASAGDILRTGR